MWPGLSGSTLVCFFAACPMTCCERLERMQRLQAQLACSALLSCPSPLTAQAFVCLLICQTHITACCQPGCSCPGRQVGKKTFKTQLCGPLGLSSQSHHACRVLSASPSWAHSSVCSLGSGWSSPPALIHVTNALRHAALLLHIVCSTLPIQGAISGALGCYAEPGWL